MLNNTLFNNDTENVLVDGLKMMTKACDALTKQNEILNRDIEELKNKASRLQERVLLNDEEKE